MDGQFFIPSSCHLRCKGLSFIITVIIPIVFPAQTPRVLIQDSSEPMTCIWVGCVPWRGVNISDSLLKVHPFCCYYLSSLISLEGTKVAGL